MTKKHKMDLPAEGLLSLMAIVVIMPIIFVIANSKPQEPVITRAAEEKMQESTPESEMMENEDVYNVYN